MSNEYMCINDIILQNNCKIFKPNKGVWYEIYEVTDKDGLQNNYMIYKPGPDYEKKQPFYMNEAVFKSAFRPYTPKFVQFKRFDSISSLNEFLAKLDRDNVKEVQDHNIYWTVLYLDGFDD